jgi:SPP1 family predicted phage head-tail adaptor
MRIGSLRHRVTLQAPGELIPDGDGGYTESWTVLGRRIPAAVEPATARTLERIAANAVASTASHLVTVRYLPGVTTKTRVVFHDVVDRTMSVTGHHDHQERHRVLVLECLEDVA